MLSGSMIINILLIILSGCSLKIMNFIAKKLYKYKFARIIGIFAQEGGIIHPFLRYFIEGYLELFFCAVIATSSLNSTILENAFKNNWSDSIAICVSLFILILLLLLPIVMLIVINKNFKKINKKSIKKKYGFLYEDLSIETKAQACFHSLFLIRRIFFIIIL
jgi:hypothetical protein